jgi:hypothetical protein
MKRFYNEQTLKVNMNSVIYFSLCIFVKEIFLQMSMLIGNSCKKYFVFGLLQILVLENRVQTLLK